MNLQYICINKRHKSKMFLFLSPGIYRAYHVNFNKMVIQILILHVAEYGQTLLPWSLIKTIYVMNC